MLIVLLALGEATRQIRAKKEGRLKNVVLSVAVWVQELTNTGINHSQLVVELPAPGKQTRLMPVKKEELPTIVMVQVVVFFISMNTGINQLVQLVQQVPIALEQIDVVLQLEIKDIITFIVQVVLV